MAGLTAPSTHGQRHSGNNGDPSPTQAGWPAVVLLTLFLRCMSTQSHSLPPISRMWKGRSTRCFMNLYTYSLGTTNLYLGAEEEAGSTCKPWRQRS